MTRFSLALILAWWLIIPQPQMDFSGSTGHVEIQLKMPSESVCRSIIQDYPTGRCEER